MKFTVLNILDTRQSERDYDTAVDLVDISVFSRFVQLRAGTGAEVVLQSTTAAKRHSHLEPDFEAFERTGQVAYQAIDEGEGNAPRVSQSGFIREVMPLPSLQPSDWEVIHRLNEDPDFDDRGLEPAQRKRVHGYFEFHMEKEDPHATGLALSKDLVAQLLAQLPPDAQRGQVVEVSLTSDQEARFVAAGQRAHQQNAANQQAFEENQITKNAWAAQKNLARAVDQLRKGLNR